MNALLDEEEKVGVWEKYAFHTFWVKGRIFPNQLSNTLDTLTKQNHFSSGDHLRMSRPKLSVHNLKKN